MMNHDIRTRRQCACSEREYLAHARNPASARDHAHEQQIPSSTATTQVGLSFLSFPLFSEAGVSLAAMASNRQDAAQRAEHQSSAADSRLFQMKEHCNQSFLVMNQLRREGQLCDISFRVGNETLSAHRIVVASVSPYLRAMFTCGMRESSLAEIELKDIEPRAMAALIDYAYTGEVMVTIDNVQDLLPAAGILQLRELKAACCAFLSDHMDTTNCLGIKQFADLHSCPELLKKANRFIIRKFVEVVKHEEFLHLPHGVLKELLYNDHLHVESEEQVFLAFIRWVNHDLSKRATNAYQLFEAIRFNLLAKTFWENVFLKEPLFQQNGECKAFMKGYLSGMSPESYVVKPRSPIEAIYTVGGRNSHRCLPTGERYVAEDNRWEELPPMKQVRTAVAVGKSEMRTPFFIKNSSREQLLTQFHACNKDTSLIRTLSSVPLVSRLDQFHYTHKFSLYL